MAGVLSVLTQLDQKKNTSSSSASNIPENTPILKSKNKIKKTWIEDYLKPHKKFELKKI